MTVNASLKILELEDNNIGDDGAKALASALEVNASLKLETLVVDSAIEHNPQLVAACRAKGVCGAPLKPACLGSECVGSCGCLQLNA